MTLCAGLHPLPHLTWEFALAVDLRLLLGAWLLPCGMGALQFIGDGEKVQELEDFGELTAILQGASPEQP
jgi:hypothetical protein